MKKEILLWIALTASMVGIFLPLRAQEIALTSDSYWHYNPQWSSDGNWIVYEKADSTGYDQIYKVPSAVGIEEGEADFNQETATLSVYPNPFATVTRFEVGATSKNKQSNIEIYDAGGRLVQSVKLETSTYHLGADLAPGVYFLKLNGKPVGKMVKVR
jgi:Tol biopolymer transport system component